MRLILSRKGFDSGKAGGRSPSPIFPDGSMIAMPIPDPMSPIRYADLTWRGRNLGEVVEQLTHGRVRREHGAHLDPDLRPEMLDRKVGWRPSLGQVASAQGHLRKQGVCSGDIFVFWALFRQVTAALRWVGPPLHYVWGWMRVGAVVPVDDDVRRNAGRWQWLGRHPHLARPRDRTNTLYVAADEWSPGGLRDRVPTAGVFEFESPARRLTAVDAAQRTEWSLPVDFVPCDRPALTFHAAPDRWVTAGDSARLRVVSRGQEFVLDLDQYPGVLAWVERLIGA